MNERAKQQYCALLLNVVSNRLGQYSTISQDCATVSQAIVYINLLLGINDQLAKNIAENINQGYLLSAGTIPLTTPYVIYGEGSEGMLVQVKSYGMEKPNPNPFNPSTTLRFDIAQAGNVSLIIYDLTGREVAKIIDGFQTAGSHSVTFDGINLASGLYFARLNAGNFSQTQKLLLLK